MIIWFDLFFLVLLCCQFGLGYENSSSADDDAEITYSDGPLHINVFNVLTDGVCILLSALKLLFGTKYLMNVSLPPKITYEYLDDGMGKFQWHTKRVKKMRHLFKNYFLVSVVSYVFIFMQTIILLFVFWNYTMIYFRYACLLIVSVLQFLALWKLNQHLKELDQ